MSEVDTRSIEERIAEAIERIGVSKKISESSTATRLKAGTYAEFIRSENLSDPPGFKKIEDEFSSSKPNRLKMKTDSAAIRYMMCLAIIGKVIPEVVYGELPANDIKIDGQIITRANIERQNEEKINKLHIKAAKFYTPGQELSKEERKGIESFLFAKSQSIDEDWQDDLYKQYHEVERLLEKIKARDAAPQKEEGYKQLEVKPADIAPEPKKKQIVGEFSEKVVKKKRRGYVKPEGAGESAATSSGAGNLDSVRGKAEHLIKNQPDELKRYAKEFLVLISINGKVEGEEYEMHRRWFLPITEELGITKNGVASDETRQELKLFFLRNNNAMKRLFELSQGTIEGNNRVGTGQQTDGGVGRQ